MTLKDALGYAIDYAKFVATLWNYYILLVVAMIGWLVTLRGNKMPLDLLGRLSLLAAYLGVTVVFWFVIRHNHQRLLKLMIVASALADAEGKGSDQTVKAAYSGLFHAGDSAGLLYRTERYFLPAMAMAVCVLIWVVTHS